MPSTILTPQKLVGFYSGDIDLDSIKTVEYVPQRKSLLNLLDSIDGINISQQEIFDVL